LTWKGGFRPSNTLTFYLINVYFPNAQRGLARLDYKLRFNQAFLDFVQELRVKKPVIIGGDFNVAHQEIDIARPKDNEKNAGFTWEERKWMTRFFKPGLHRYLSGLCPPGGALYLVHLQV